MTTLHFHSADDKSPYTWTKFNPYEYPLYPAEKGWRHEQLVAFAGHLRYHGAEETELDRQLTEADSQFDVPRKDPREIERIAHFAAEHWLPGEYTCGAVTFDVHLKGLGWLAEHCFDPFFSGKRGCVDFAVLYVMLLFASRVRKIDINASCRDVALEAGVTPITAARSLRRLCQAGLLKRVGRRKMHEAQTYSLGTVLCLQPTPHPWVDLTSAMFRVSRAATKFQLFYGDTWQNPFSTRNALTPSKVGVESAKRQAAKQILKRKGLESLEKADDSDWRLKMMLRFQHERKAFADFVWRVRREKRFQRGKEGKLVLKMAA